MDVSIIIPAFNAEKTIKACIESILCQKTGKKFEIIVVDDGSKDKTAEIAGSFKKARLLRQKNSGPAVARNNGARQAKAPVIIFTDSDCLLDENWLEEMILPFKNLKVAGVQGKYNSSQKELMARFVQREIEERYEQMKKTEFIDFMGSYSAAFRKKDFLAFNGFDESFPMASGEDTDLSFRMSSKGLRFKFAEKAIVWHQHPKSFLKYLKTKFFRAFWRVKLYNKNRSKIAKDSYTPQFIKFQIGFLWLSIISIIAFWASKMFGLLQFLPFAFLSAIFLLLCIALSLPKAEFMAKKQVMLGIAAFPIDFLVSFAFSLGLLAGTIKEAFLK
ncbi:MAG: glycosyltransferase [Candidatus Diapherotrites archaeon]|nr:glycosyltransferase [Candidatus Diapherotrites archaeon]